MPRLEPCRTLFRVGTLVYARNYGRIRSRGGQSARRRSVVLVPVAILHLGHTRIWSGATGSHTSRTTSFGAHARRVGSVAALGSHVQFNHDVVLHPSSRFRMRCGSAPGQRTGIRGARVLRVSGERDLEFHLLGRCRSLVSRSGYLSSVLREERTPRTPNHSSTACYVPRQSTVGRTRCACVVTGRVVEEAAKLAGVPQAAIPDGAEHLLHRSGDGGGLQRVYTMLPNCAVESVVYGRPVPRSWLDQQAAAHRQRAMCASTYCSKHSYRKETARDRCVMRPAVRVQHHGLEHFR